MTEHALARALRDAIRARMRDGREARAHAFSNRAVATRAGLSESYMSMITHGRSKSLPMLLRVAAAIGVKVEVRINGAVVD